MRYFIGTPIEENIERVKCQMGVVEVIEELTYFTRNIIRVMRIMDYLARFNANNSAGGISKSH